MTAADADLVRAAQSGDAESFGALVERHQRLVFSASLAASADPSAAQDITQEAFIAAWRSLDSLREPGALRGWLAGIARNTARNHHRARRREVLGILETDGGAQTPEDAEPLADDALSAAQKRRELWEVVATIPDRYREPLVLFYREEQSVKQVATDLGLSEQVVKQRLSRGRKALREGMERRLAAEARRARPRAGLAAAVVAAIAALPVREAAAAGAAGGLALFTKGLLTMKGLIKAGAAVALIMFVFLGVSMLRGGHAESGEHRDDATPPRGRVAPRLARAERMAAAASARGESADATMAALRGVVVDEDGEPIAGATVRARGDSFQLGEGSATEAVLTGADGRFSLRAFRGRRHHLAATAPGYRPGSEYDQLPGDGEVRLVLTRGGLSLQGQVRDIGGGPVPGATVSYYPLGQGSVLGLDKPAYAALTDDGGRYALALTPGSYVATASHPDYASADHSTTVTVAHTVDDFELVPGATVDGVVRRRSDGAPIPGATVIAFVAPESQSMGSMFAMMATGGATSFRRTRADSQGRFNLGGLGAGEVYLTARAPGYAAREPSRFVAHVAERRGAQTVWVEAGVRVRGRVVDADSGQPIAGAAVTVTSASNPTSASGDPAEADRRGEFELFLAPGTHQLLGFADGYQLALAGSSVEVGDRDVEGAVVELRPGAVVRGRIEPAEAAMIVVMPAGKEDSLHLKGLLAAAGTQGRVHDDGTFELRGAPRNALGLMAQTESGRIGTHEVDTTDGDADDVVIRTDARASVSGQVVDDGGRPVAGATVRLRSSSMAGMMGMDSLIDAMLSSSARTNERGEFRLAPVKGAGKGAVLEVEVRDRRDHRTKVLEGGSLRVARQQRVSGHRIVVEENAGALRGRVVDAAGAPVADAVVTPDGGGGGAITSTDGSFELEGLPEGEYTLHARHTASGQRASAEGVRAEQPVRMTLSAAVSVEVKVLGATGEVAVYAGGEGDSRELRRSGDTWKGRRLSPGRTTISAFGEEEHGHIEVELEAGEHRVIELSVARYGRVEGKLVDAAGSPVADAGFRIEHPDAEGGLASAAEISGVMLASPDRDGYFSLKVSDGPATLFFVSSSGSAEREIDLAPGETLDLGTVVLPAPAE